MKSIKPGKSYDPDRRSTSQYTAYILTNIWHLFSESDANHSRPIGLLVPGKKITSKTEAHNNQKHSDSSQPSCFSWKFISPHKKYPEHMKKNCHDHSGRSPNMQSAYKGSAGYSHN